MAKENLNPTITFGPDWDYFSVKDDLTAAKVNFALSEKRCSMLANNQIITTTVGELFIKKGQKIEGVEVLKIDEGYLARGIEEDLYKKIQKKKVGTFTHNIENGSDEVVLKIADSSELELFIKLTKKFYRKRYKSSTIPTGQ